MDLEYARRVAIEAAEAAGAMLRESAGRLRVRPKGDSGDVVTDLDLAIEAVLINRVLGAFPTHRVIAEESGVHGSGEWTWLIDPLDGTNNIAGDDTALLDEHVWAARTPGDGAADWMAGGSYVVARRIRMHIETWDRTSLKEQQDVFGRMKGEGNPYGAKREHDPVPLGSLPADSHVRLAHPDSNGGVRILRRGYSFTDGSDGLGRLDAGLFFIAYQRDPRTQFVALQNRLAGTDHMNEYVEHVGSGVFACPPGVRKGGFWGQPLFA